ncbi:rCG61684, partial [Rattus norvegicus]
MTYRASHRGDKESARRGNESSLM